MLLKRRPTIYFQKNQESCSYSFIREYTKSCSWRKAVIILEEKMDINRCSGKLIVFLKKQSSGYKSKKSKILMGERVDREYRKALYCALSTEKPNEDIIHLLTQNGLDVNAKDNNGTTAIHLACGAGNLNILNLLLQNRGELGLLNNDGENVLHFAASQQNRDINLTLFLIPNGLSVNSKDNTKTTPLHLACQHGNIVVAQTLLSKGAEVDSLDMEKENALHYAMCTTNNNPGILDLLINGGIDINVQNSDG
ncbi:putative ankyrin repeat protein RF_0381 [Zophobas morio]|uniref:putative ankyrin repeat protein RF_0381 n=1 Tax=Zophobas morio TaxID=2755281 RepID=UPI003083DDA2